MVAAIKKRLQAHVDYWMVGIVAVLLVFGLAMLYSASTVMSYSVTGHSNSYYFLHQLLYGGVAGLVLAYVCTRVDYHFWQRAAPWALLGAVVLLVAVLVPHVGIKVGGSRRWLSLGPLGELQPAELVKLALVFYIASWVDRRSGQIKDFMYGVLPSLGIAALCALLILLEPDVGTMLVVSITALVMLYVGGTQVKHLAWIVGIAALAFLVLVTVAPYRVARFTAFLNPSADTKGIGYQMNQALVAIGSGGAWGYGYGHSREKYSYLPEVMGDSIFAVTVEELGAVGGSLVVIAFACFAMRGMAIARGAPDTFGRMLAIGIVTWVTVEALINIGAIIGILPLTGIPLPFISYGSSALTVTLASMGILLNVSKHSGRTR
jgi:cell division protein FtsW